MGEVYNPETDLLEGIERYELEARRLAIRLRSAQQHNRAVLSRQLQEAEAVVERLRKRARRIMR